MRRTQQLLARFHRAGSGDDHNSWPADVHAAHLHDGSLRLHLTADQLKGLGDGHHVVDSGRDLQRFDLVAASVPHGGDDGALDAARNVRLVAGLANALDDVRNLLFGGFLGHVDDHWLAPCEWYVLKCSRQTKSRDLDRGFKACLNLDDLCLMDHA